MNIFALLLLVRLFFHSHLVDFSEDLTQRLDMDGSGIRHPPWDHFVHGHLGSLQGLLLLCDNTLNLALYVLHLLGLRDLV